jgi:hypothetical protein
MSSRRRKNTKPTNGTKSGKQKKKVEKSSKLKNAISKLPLKQTLNASSPLDRHYHVSFFIHPVSKEFNQLGAQSPPPPW